MTHTTERPQRIELGNSGWYIDIAAGAITDPDGWYRAFFTKEDRAYMRPFAAALNEMQPDVTGDDKAVAKEVAASIGYKKPLPEFLKLAEEIIARHRQSAVDQALREEREKVASNAAEAHNKTA